MEASTLLPLGINKPVGNITAHTENKSLKKLASIITPIENIESKSQLLPVNAETHPLALDDLSMHSNAEKLHTTSLIKDSVTHLMSTAKDMRNTQDPQNINAMCNCYRTALGLLKLGVQVEKMKQNLK